MRDFRLIRLPTCEIVIFVDVCRDVKLNYMKCNHLTILNKLPKIIKRDFCIIEN